MVETWVGEPPQMLNLQTELPDPTHQPTQPPIHPPMGGGATTDVESSNRTDISIRSKLTEFLLKWAPHSDPILS